jgi:hypothetical protein
MYSWVINITILINHLKKEEEGQATVTAAPGGGYEVGDRSEGDLSTMMTICR